MKGKMDALIFFFFVSQILYVFGEVTVLMGSSTPRKMICLSEDDGGALVWNDLNWNNRDKKQRANQQFRSINKSNNEIDCKMNAQENCLNKWAKQNWSLTNSFLTPMGPVFDQRWEEFKEYENPENRYDRVDYDFRQSYPPAYVALSFSVRASNDAYILLCNGTNYMTDFCYWIIIGGWENTLSVIRKCPTGVPSPDKYPSGECSKLQVFATHTPLSATEWRSFILTWNSGVSMTQNITLYNTDNMIMTYEDRISEELKFLHTDYHIFIRSRTTMLFRFHLYNFLHTNRKDATLTSPSFNFDNETVCIQLLIGLCAECYAHVMLRDSTNYEMLEIITVKGSSKAAIHGLPMWQSVKIKKQLPTANYTSVVIQLIPKLNTPSSNPLWAIANVRQCPPNDSLRRGVISSNRTDETCQKLFYDEHAIVHSTFARLDMRAEYDVECPEGKIGPQCLFSCERDLESNADCQGTAICYKRSCTCPPGFIGSKCDAICEIGKYGHNCNKMCGFCNPKLLLSGNPLYTGRGCNKVTGVCDNGCWNKMNLYIRPLCQISLYEPITPVINSTSKTSVRAIVPDMIWKDEYEKETIFYSFSIKATINKDVFNIQQPWSKVIPRVSKLIGNFENLEPGIIYYIKCSLRIEDSIIDSKWQTAETDCNPTQNFNITAEETSLTINWQAKDQLYSCPTHWYRLKVRQINIDKYIYVDEQNMYFPYKVSSLTSYTSFNVSILHKYDELFFQETRTLEGVPSEVLDLEIRDKFNTQVILIWRTPFEPNGEIIRYDVILKVKEYYGCRDFNLPAPNNHIIKRMTKYTTITILDLHPYAYYSAQVTAYNSRHGSLGSEITFNTSRSEIPTEIFSQFKLQDWILTWSIPENCATISGPLKTKIKIYGISEAVKDFNVEINIALYSFDLKNITSQLYGAERYMAKIYVIRDRWSLENISAYQEYEFKTPPAAPPQVINLEVVETDTRHTPVTVHLRWQSPLPPFNGILDYYAIRICDSEGYSGTLCQIIPVQLNKSCDLWDDYICGSFKKTITNSKIEVLAYNVNVTQPSLSVKVTKAMLSNTTPDAPGNYTFTIRNNSIVDLSWQHPWKANGHLQCFRIWVEEISSNLAGHVLGSLDKKHEYIVTDYMRYYNERLYLFPSTLYYIHIQAETVTKKLSSINTVTIQTPSTMNFDGDLDAVVQNFTILLNIPSVLNDTQGSIIHIIVKGPNPCEDHSEVPESLRGQAGVKTSDTAWQAAEISTSELVGTLFTVGDNKTYGNARNCPLEIEDLYEITVILTKRGSHAEPITLKTLVRIGEIQSTYYETYGYIWWLIPIILSILCVVIAGATFYFCRRKRLQSALQSNIPGNELMPQNDLQDEMILQNIKNYRHENRKDELIAMLTQK